MRANRQVTVNPLVPKSSRRLILCFLILGHQGAAAESGDWHISVQESVVNANGFSKPAVVSYSNPKDGSSSYNIDAGVSLSRVLVSDESLDKKDEVVSSRQWDFVITAEGHRNSVIKNPTNTLALNLSVLGAIDTSVGIDTVGWFPTFNVKFKEDQQKDTDSIILMAKTGALYRPWGVSFYRPASPTPGSFRYYWSPELGVEHERFEKGAGNPAGHVSRVYAGLSISSQTPIDRVIAGLDLRSWHDFAETDAIDDGSDAHDYLNPYASFRIYESQDEQSKIDLRFDYVKGEDPLQGLSNQEYSQLGIRFLISL